MLKLSDLKNIAGLGRIIEKAEAEEKAAAERAARPITKAAERKALIEENERRGKVYGPRMEADWQQVLDNAARLQASQAKFGATRGELSNWSTEYQRRLTMLEVELQDLAVPAVPAFVAELETMLADTRVYRSVGPDRRRVIGEPDEATGDYEVALQVIGAGASRQRRVQAIVDALAEARTLHQLAPAEGEQRIRELRASVPPLVDGEVINETRQTIAFGHEPDWTRLELRLQPGVLLA